jgi:hypothetical protein
LNGSALFLASTNPGEAVTSLLDRLLRLRLASSLDLDDSAAREKRIAELRSLLDEIAVRTDDGSTSRAAEPNGHGVPQASSVSGLEQPARLSA